MSYVIVNVAADSTAYRKGYAVAVYATERGAKIACTKLNRVVAGVDEDGTKLFLDRQEWAVITYADYMARPTKMVERTNALTGAKFMEAADTPYSCSPSSESYWSS